jgi:hypothetical protein
VVLEGVGGGGVRSITLLFIVFPAVFLDALRFGCHFFAETFDVS